MVSETLVAKGINEAVTDADPLKEFINPNPDENVRRKSRLEINFIRLLGKTEEMGKESSANGSECINWRFPKYVQALTQFLAELRNGPNQPDRETIQGYTRRVDFLKELIGVLNPQSSTIGSPDTTDSNIAKESFLLSPLGPTNSPSSPSGQIRQRHKVKLLDDMRRELFGGTTNDNPDEIDSGSASTNTPTDVNELLKYHHSVQEKIAEQMLDLAKNLKEQAVVAGTIVKKDTEILEKGTTQIDKNTRNLAVESQKLEMFNRRACKCWTWIMLIMVCSIFISMVLFMRLFKKSTRS